MGFELEEEVAMNGDVKDRFDKLDRHLEKQDEHLSGIARSFHAHELTDSEVHTLVKAHIAEHEGNRKFRVLLWISIVGAVAGSFALVVLEYVKHHVH